MIRTRSTRPWAPTRSTRSPRSSASAPEAARASDIRPGQPRAWWHVMSQTRVDASTDWHAGPDLAGLLHMHADDGTGTRGVTLRNSLRCNPNHTAAPSSISREDDGQFVSDSETGQFLAADIEDDKPLRVVEDLDNRLSDRDIVAGALGEDADPANCRRTDRRKTFDVLESLAFVAGRLQPLFNRVNARRPPHALRQSLFQLFQTAD